MKLSDLRPEWVTIDGCRAGVEFDCPCCGPHVETSPRLVIFFANPLEGRPHGDERRRWQRTGEALEELTLSPSIHRTDPQGCGWHGFVTAGEVTSV